MSRANSRQNRINTFTAEPLEGRLMFATAYAWKAAVSGPWNVGTNWQPTGVPGPNDTASITLPGNYTVTMPNSSVTVDGLTIGHSSSGAQLVSEPANGSLLLTTNSLTINSQGRLDLNDNDMLVNYPSASVLSTIENHIRNAFYGTGGGIFSSGTQTNGLARLGAVEASDFWGFWAQFNIPPYTGSVPFNSASITSSTKAVLVKFTYVGDANLDGLVNSDDMANQSTGFWSQSGGWFNGDFDYGDQVNFDDFAILDYGFNLQGAPL